MISEENIEKVRELISEMLIAMESKAWDTCGPGFFHARHKRIKKLLTENKEEKDEI